MKRNGPYVYPRLDSILELCGTFPNVLRPVSWDGLQSVIVAFPDNTDLRFGHTKQTYVLIFVNSILLTCLDCFE